MPFSERNRPCAKSTEPTGTFLRIAAASVRLIAAIRSIQINQRWVRDRRITAVRNEALGEAAVKSFMMLGLVVLAAAGCATTYIAPPDPIPVIGAQLMGSSGSCADLRDGVTADGTPIILFQCHGSSNQRWFIRNGGISQNVGGCIDVQGGAAVEDSPIILVSCNGAASQRWSITNGEIVGVGALCLSAMGGATADLTPLVLSPCKATAGQLWTVQ
jgi:hypothetical protein